MRLNLGCSDQHRAGFTNVDLCPPADVIADLRARYPWEDSSIEEICAGDFIEHIADKLHTMNECWRVLRPGGLFTVVVPTTDGPGAFQDPTHVSFWNRRSFLYYTKGCPYRERFAAAYGIRAAFEVVREGTQQTVDGPKLTIVLRAVK